MKAVILILKAVGIVFALAVSISRYPLVHAVQVSRPRHVIEGPKRTGEHSQISKGTFEV